MMTIRTAVGALALMLVSHTHVAAQDMPDDFVISLARTSCYGSCPIYSVSVDAKGQVTYDGKEFTRITGRATASISPSGVRKLFAAVEALRFFELRDRYGTVRHADGTETMVTDLPTAYVTVSYGGRTKRIENYLGAPRGLRQLEDQIDELTRSRRWVRIDARTLLELAREGTPPTPGELGEFLESALRHDDVEEVKTLLDLGADPNALPGGDAGRTPPLLMVQSAAAARALLDAGAVVRFRTEHGRSPLAVTVHRPADLAVVLLKAGVPPDDPIYEDGEATALHGAACNGNAGVVHVLLEAGANPAVAVQGQSALDCARTRRDPSPDRDLSTLLGTEPPFVKDYDGVIAALERALARRGKR